MLTIKYFPQNGSQIFGQDEPVAELKDYIVNYKSQKKKAALVWGPIGNGKTSSIYALANELNYDVFEINSSDLRKADNITKFLDASLGQQTLFFKPKIILIDEIDNISGMKDRGCIQAITKCITNSSFPVIITANDPFDKKFKLLQKVSKMIEYSKLDYKIISHAIQWVCEKEKIPCEPKAANTLARQVDGDLRGALIDIEICANGLTMDNINQLSDRKRTHSILKALQLIFKSSSIDNARPALFDVDIDMDQVFLWIDYNLPREYLSAKSLAKAYESLSRADVFRGRIRRQQHWRFLAYINDLLTAGISSAKDEKNPAFVQYKQTSRLLRIWQANMKHAKKKEIAKKLAAVTHTSKKVALQEVMFLKHIAKQNPQIAEELELTDDEVNWLKA